MLPLASHRYKGHCAQQEGISFGTKLCPSSGQDQPCLELHHAMQLSPVSPTRSWDGRGQHRLERRKRALLSCEILGV